MLPQLLQGPPIMHDDTNIRSLFSGPQPHGARPHDALSDSDMERRVLHRTEIVGTDLTLIEEVETEAAQDEDLEPVIRELPLNSETLALRAEIALLRQAHKDLDESILALGVMPQPDQILIARLKRKKLALRDRIVSLEDRVRPDIIA